MSDWTPEEIRDAHILVLKGQSRPSSQHESVRYVGAARVDDVLNIGLQTEPRGKLDLICCLQYDFIART
jgi:hypothetical protein